MNIRAFRSACRRAVRWRCSVPRVSTPACVAGDFVSPDDVQAVARWVIAHRLVLKPEAALDGETDLGIVGAILEATPVPR